MKKLISLLLLALCVSVTACRSTSIDPVTGEKVKVFDPIKTQQAKEIVEPILRIGTRRIILNNPDNAIQTGNYFRYAGGVFCYMKETGQLDPTSITAGLRDLIPENYLAKEDVQIGLDFKVSLEALYRQFYNQRLRAELPPDKWAYHVADLFCNAIDAGLRDAGQPGCK